MNRMTTLLPQKEILSGSTTLPFSAAVGYGELVFISGTIGRNPANGEIAARDVPAQTRQTLLNIQKRLELAGTSLDKVLKATVFLTDMNQFGQMNEVYRGFFAKEPPARSCLGVTALPDPEALVEIEVIAGR
jgi:2-iminobutanoate/2-iminopropanoate deaminase